MTTQTFDRRRILIGLAASATAATAGTAAGATERQEIPELVEMGNQIEAVADRYISACAEVERIAEEWSPQWPTPSGDIISYSVGSKPHQDILGAGVALPWGTLGVTRVQNVGIPEAFKAAAERHRKEAERRSKFKTQRGMGHELHWAERSAAAVEPSRAYWAEIERIKAASGIEAAKGRREATLRDLRNLVDRILGVEERTAWGLAIKAQALQAWHANVEPFRANFDPETMQWAKSISAAIIRQASAA